MAPLTNEQKQMVRNTWAAFNANSKSSMVVFYQHLLHDYPQYKSHFPQVANIHTVDFPNNSYIKDVQGPKIGGAIADLVAKLDDFAALHSTITKMVLAPKHINVLKKEDYANAFKSLIAAMGKVLGEKMKLEEVQAWARFSELICGIIGSVLTQDQKAAIRNTWGEFSKHRIGMVTFYQVLLTDYPQYAEHFPALKGVKPCEFVENAYVRDIQGPKIGAAIATLVFNLENMAGIRDAVAKVAAVPAHAQLHLGHKDYSNAFKALIAAMGKVLGDKFKMSDVYAWAKFGHGVVGLLDFQ